MTRAERPGVARRLRHRTGELSLGARVLVMGVLNATPDSFSDGGLLTGDGAAVEAGLRMAREGADILDLGGESTRPGHAAVAADEEWSRVAPTLDALGARADLPPISIDTWKAGVAGRALAAGAAIVNDVWGLKRDPAMAELVAGSGAAVVLMHNRDEVDPTIDIVEDVLRGLEASLAIAARAGIADDRIVLDPGIGFGRTWHQSFATVAGLDRLRRFGLPILLGLSRKAFIGSLSEPPSPTAERLGGTVAGNIWGAVAGADIIRVHDVAPHVQALRMWDALKAAA